MFEDVKTWPCSLIRVCEEEQWSLRRGERWQESLESQNRRGRWSSNKDRSQTAVSQRINERGRDEERRDGDEPVTLKTNDRISGRNNWSR